jgi:anti-anti-sigma factor
VHLDACSVILSAAKNLEAKNREDQEILRCAQDDKRVAWPIEAPPCRPVNVGRALPAGTLSRILRRLTLARTDFSLRIVVKERTAVSIENWSEKITVAELQDDPAFTDDLAALIDQTSERADRDVVLNFSGVGYVNSSNIAKLLKLRKQLISHRHRLVLCGIDMNVWGIFLVTGLDKVFEFADSVATGLATVQIAAGK